MKYGIISDIHGNLSALQATLKIFEKSKIDKLVCLGDLVGYGPQPNECIRLINENADVFIAGNHDYAAVGKSPDDNFNPHAKAALDWTRQELSDQSRQLLQAARLSHRENNLFFVHATPDKPEYWNYIPSLFEAYTAFSGFNEQICFIGHSHIPVTFSQDSERKIQLVFETQIRLLAENRYIINVGSVGQPRDNDARAAFGIFDTGAGMYSMQRKQYAVSDTQAKMRKAGLPEYLVKRLKHGQ